jgi:hypothetical protein
LYSSGTVASIGVPTVPSFGSIWSVSLASVWSAVAGTASATDARTAATHTTPIRLNMCSPHADDPVPLLKGDDP